MILKHQLPAGFLVVLLFDDTEDTPTEYSKLICNKNIQQECILLPRHGIISKWENSDYFVLSPDGDSDDPQI